MVTLFFSDIEGSTRLVRRLGEQEYGRALSDHRQILRAVIARLGGQEVDCRADEFFAVFAKSGQAVAAAVAAQRELAAHEWPGESSVLVRIGLNAGTLVVVDGAYLGLDVNRAARICSAGHGGQVLISQAVRDAVADEVGLSDLGEYVLAGLPTPERIFQLVIPGARLAFPPLRASAATNRRGRLARVRSRPTVEPALGSTAWQVRSLLPEVSGELRPGLVELGGKLFAGQRAINHADGFLSRIDHRKLATRLSEQRQMAPFLPSAERAASTTETQITAVAEATHRRQALADCATQALALLSDIEAMSRSTVLALTGRVADATTVLDDSVTTAAALVDPLSFKLARTRSRGVYRSGDRYLVPYTDNLGTDRVQDFATRAEGRRFRLATRIAHQNAQRPRDPPRGALGGG